MSTSPSAEIEQDLAAYLSSAPDAMSNPYPLLTRIRDTGPAYFHAAGPAWIVTTHGAVKAALSDHERLSNRGYADGTRAAAARAALPEADRPLLDEVNAFELMMVSRSDGEQHARLRRIAHRAFTPRRIAELGERVSEYTDELLDEIDGKLSGGERVVDLMSDLAKRLPTMVIAEMVDVPPQDRGLIRGWADTISKNRGGHNAAALRGAHGAVAEFRAYLGRMIVASRDDLGGQELVATLLEAHDGERLSEEELLAMFVVLLFAGTETTTNLIAIGIWSLLREREQWERLVAEPSRIPRAVEELLRYVTPVQYLMRVALVDIEIGNAQIRRGDSVLLSIAAANHDPAVFAEPDRMVLDRDPNPHLALAFGPHFCLGASLARLEAQIVFERLTTRFPEMTLAADSLTFAGNAMLRTVEAVPIAPGGARAFSSTH
jgi:cytochrome P450